MTFRDNAPGLRALGFNVFPTHAPGMAATKSMIDPETSDVDEKQIGKAPLVKWKQYQTERVDDGVFEGWLRRWHAANIAICCGPVSGLLVLDVDGIEAAQALQDLEDQHGALPDSWRVSTSRGAHIYFRYTGADLRNTNGELGVGIESKTKGATVHAVGSRHRSGHAYDWVPGCSPADGPLADAPEWLLALLRTPVRAALPQLIKRTKKVTPESIGWREAAYRDGAWRDMIGKIVTAAEGTRNTTLFSVAANARRWVNAGAMDAAEVEGVLTLHARQIGLSQQEIDATIKSAFASAESQLEDLPDWWGRPEEPKQRTRHPMAPIRAALEAPAHDPETGEILEPVRANGYMNGHDTTPLALSAPVGDQSPRGFVAHWEAHDRPVNLQDEAALGYCCAQELTDLGNAHRMLAWFASVIRFSKGTGWMWFDGKKWVMSELAVARLAQQTIKRIKWEMGFAGGDAHLRELEKHYKASQASGRFAAMMQCARSMCEFDPRRMDQDHYLLNTLSGVVNLRTGEVMPHGPQYLVTKIAPFEIAPEGDRPERFLKFMQDICCDDDRLLHFLHLAMGYSMSGDTRHQCLFFLFGEGQNGKSQLLNVLIHILGDYAVTDRPDIILANDVRGGGNPEYRFIRFQGARVFYTSELPNDATLGVDTVKRITGGDKMIGRHLQESHIEFMPTHKVWFMSNTKPAVDDQTHGTWRRIRLVPFNAKFDGVNKADEKEIYKALLEEEGPQILRWLVDGCMLQAGRKDLDIPPVVLDATAEYKEEEDVLGDFIQDNFVRASEGMVSKADAYDALVKWATYRQDARLKKWSRQRFGKRMEESGFRRTKDSKGVHQFKGLDWKPAAETPWRQSGAYTSRPGPHNPPPMGHDWVREYEA